MEQNLITFLKNAAERFGEKPALLIKPGLRYQTWSYQDVWEQSGKVASLLWQMGIEKGDRVAIWAPNSPQWVFAFFGSLRAGAIPVPIDLRSDEGFVSRVVEKSRLSLGFASRLSPGAGAALGVKIVLLEDLESRISDLCEPRSISIASEDLAEIVFTSGTTGDPKGVMLTHRNILADLEAVRHFIPGASYYRILSLLPLSHMFEQTAGLFMPFSCGADITYLTSMHPASILKTMKERRVVTMLLAPQVLTLFMNGIEAEVARTGKQRTWFVMQQIAARLPMRLRQLVFLQIHNKLGGSLEFFVVGGAALDPEQTGKWTVMGIKIIQGYGTTETAPIIATHPLSKPGYDSVGLPLPGIEVKIANDGEVLVKGEIVTPGYWEAPAQTAAIFENGWYKTGDIGWFDTAGCLHLSGRKKDIIVLPTGQNVYPEDIEQVLNRHPDVVSSSVVGLDHGTRVHAVAVMREGSDIDKAVRWTNAQLAEYQHIHGATVWPDGELPRTHTMKVKKHEVIKLIETEGTAVSGRIARPKPKTPTSVESIIAQIAQVTVADVQAHLKIGEDLGLDSLSRLELVSAIESELGAYIDETLVAPSTTVGTLESMVAAHSGAKVSVQVRQWPLLAPLRVLRQVLQSAVVFPIYRAYARPRVTGLQNLKDILGPVLIASNHTSHFDSVAVLDSLPPRLRNRTAVAAAQDYFFAKRWLGLFISVMINGFPFAREGAVRPTLEYCAWLIDKRWSVLIYPEGTRSVTGKIGEFKSGTGLLATQMGVPVVPVGLVGLSKILPKGQTIPRRGNCEIHIGKPLFICPLSSYDGATKAIRAAIDELVRTKNQGVTRS